jgi:hypothetical protein
MPYVMMGSFTDPDGWRKESRLSLPGVTHLPKKAGSRTVTRHNQEG